MLQNNISNSKYKRPSSVSNVRQNYSTNPQLHISRVTHSPTTRVRSVISQIPPNLNLSLRVPLPVPSTSKSWNASTKTSSSEPKITSLSSPYSSSPGRTSIVQRNQQNVIYVNSVSSHTRNPIATHQTPKRPENRINYSTVRSSSAANLYRRNYSQNTANRISNPIQDGEHAADIRITTLPKSSSTSSINLKTNVGITLMDKIRGFHISSKYAKARILVMTFADIVLYSKSRAVKPKSSSCSNLRLKM